jgi:hypothetical protein
LVEYSQKDEAALVPKFWFPLNPNALCRGFDGSVAEATPTGRIFHRRTPSRFPDVGTPFRLTNEFEH